MIYKAEIIKQIMDKDGITPSSNPLYESEIIAPYLTNGVNEYESELLLKNIGYTPEQTEHPNILQTVTLEVDGDASFFPYKQLSYSSLSSAPAGTNVNNFLSGNNYGFIFKITTPKSLNELFSGTSTYMSITKVNFTDGEFFKDQLIIEEIRQSINDCNLNVNAYKTPIPEGYYLCSFYYQSSKTLHFNDGVLTITSDVPILGPSEMM